MNQRSDVLSVHHALQVSNLVHVENIDGQIVIVTHHNSREIHYFQVALEHFSIADVAELRGCGAFSGSAV